MENIGNQINNHTIDPRVVINPPPQLTMDTHIPTWLELVELYVLKEKVEDVKYTIMMGYVQPEVMKQLNITSQSKSRAEEINRWLDMKEQLMKLHEAKFNENFEEDNINFKTMGERIQGINESTSQFGKSLLEMAQKLLKSDNIATLKDTLQSQFIYGLNNKDIAEKLMTRLYDRKLEKKELSMQETLDYANHLEQVFKTTKKCNDQIEAKRNVCSLNNANNVKPKNNENTCNNRNTNEAKQNYANNNQEQQWSSIKPTTSQYQNKQISYQNNNNTRSWKHPPYNNYSHMQDRCIRFNDDQQQH
jgi:hypothetical protein